ncbi:hypothetical protein HN873_061158 [Arachis hypogaea]
MHGGSRIMSNCNRRWSMKNCSSEGVEEHVRKSYDGTCFCRLQVVALKSKTRRNPGRWFFRCPLWKVCMNMLLHLSPPPRLRIELDELYLCWADEEHWVPLFSVDG